jgi:hypothetical protein
MEPRRALRAAKNNKTRKVIAIIAAAAVAGVGASLSLAAWNDTEWLFADNGTGGAGIVTDTFELEQVALPTDGDDPGAVTWADYETNPGNGVTFTVTNLSPTENKTYALVAVKSKTGSVAGTATLASAVAATDITISDPTALLWNAITQKVETWEGTSIASGIQTCDATTFATDESIATGALGTAAATAAQDYDADGANINFYCFELTFTVPGASNPDTYMGRSIAPAWKFDAVSD